MWMWREAVNQVEMRSEEQKCAALLT